MGVRLIPHVRPIHNRTRMEVNRMENVTVVVEEFEVLTEWEYA